MPPTPENVSARIRLLTEIVPTAAQRRIVEEQLQAAVEERGLGGDGGWGSVLEGLSRRLSKENARRLRFADSLADWSGDNAKLVKDLTARSEVSSLRDVAVRFGVDDLAALVDVDEVPAELADMTPEDRARAIAVSLRRGLFEREPTAVVQRMTADGEIPTPGPEVRDGLTQFFEDRPDFDIRTTSIRAVLKDESALKAVPVARRPAVAEQLMILQRVQAISPVPEAIPALISESITSAHVASQLTELSFLRLMEGQLGERVARQVHANATAANFRNENALMRMRDAVRGTGLAIIDGDHSPETRISALQAVADEQSVPLNLSDLFGDIDYCECDDCLSVYSPAAYFVELLQYLRNNNLSVKNSATGKPGIAGTPLEKLLRRRPDLGCLELTCENTFTVLPYIDLVNEVMESFVVHLDDYHGDSHDPRQAVLEAFNVDDETSPELVAQPQHVNYEAYCILKSAIYPFSLPYHQPIDSARIWLKALSTSRYELLDVFRTATETCEGVQLSSAQEKRLRELHAIVQDRAVYAEYLRMTQEDFIILTREAFWPKEYFELTKQHGYSDVEYRANIGVKAVHSYYGYVSAADMLSSSETTRAGLRFVKDQLLRRTGIHYAELVDILRTRFINPAYPVGRARTILESIRLSYRFLQSLVDSAAADPARRYAKLVQFLSDNHTTVPSLTALLHPDPCHEDDQDRCINRAELENWVHCYFERIGKLIVLESQDEPRLPFEGPVSGLRQVFEGPAEVVELGYLHRDGEIVDTTGTRIGEVTADSRVVDTEGAPLINTLNPPPDPRQYNSVIVSDPTTNFQLATIEERGLVKDGELVSWTPALDTCDLDKVRLVHLDGTAVTVDEFDRLHRFVRLWRRLGWTITETDQALVAVSARTGPGTLPAAGDDGCDFVTFEIFADDCPPTEDGDPAGGGNCPDIPPAPELSVRAIGELATISRLLEATGLPLERLLTFWAEIGTTGERPLYDRVFLTRNLLGIDKVFQPDTNGNYLAASEKISDHIPVLMAALRLKADEIEAIATFRGLGPNLTLATVSVLYRHSILARLLHLRVADLISAIGLFGDPFTTPSTTFRFLEDWRRIDEAGFTVRQVAYVVNGHDDPKRPLGPTPRAVLGLAKALYDGIGIIEADHPDLAADQGDLATDALVRAKSALLFDTATVERIVGSLNGITIYSTNAPSGQQIVFPDALAKTASYTQRTDVTPSRATLQITGILSAEDVALTKSLSAHPDWAKAVDRLGRQPARFFQDYLSGLFADPAAAAAVLLAADSNPAPDASGAAPAATPTAPGKRLFFLKTLLPTLRRRLANRLAVDTAAAAAALNPAPADVLLSEILHIDGGEWAVDALTGVRRPAVTADSWTGYLIAPTADAYTLSAISETAPPPLTLDGAQVAFPHQQEDPSDVWQADPIALKPGVLYRFELNGLDPGQLQWKTSTLPPTTIPTSALLPDHSTAQVREVLVKLFKAALVVNGFGISTDELSYFHAYPGDFDGLDFNAMTLGEWRRLCAYRELRDALPRGETSLLDLFRWANTAPDGTHLVERIARATLWEAADIATLLAEDHFDLARPAEFRHEANLVKMLKAIMVARRGGTAIGRLFRWANPTSAFWPAHHIAADIRAALRARYDQEDWERVVKPLYDELRENQQRALVSYLLVQQDVIDWGVVDADSLFEFFLIDVQMSSCMETSRIKQAISTVQSFVQRCLLGLEGPHGVPRDELDRERWNWMQKYRVWEANRKVYCYPENWLKAELRDDKTDFFKDLESALLQKDINSETVKDALRDYAINVDEVANLRVMGLFLEDSGKLHIFARTRNAPYRVRYRYYDRDPLARNWYPWQEVKVDIPSYEHEEASGDQVKIIENGTYLIPVVLQGRLLIFFPQLAKKTAPTAANTAQTFDAMAGKSVDASKPLEYWEIKMGWSEYRNGKWTPKQVSTTALYEPNPTTSVPHVRDYEFVPRVVTDPSGKIVIDAYRDKEGLGSFIFTRSQLTTSGQSLVSPKGPAVSDLHFHTRPPGDPNQGAIFSLQGVDSQSPMYSNSEPFFRHSQEVVTFQGGQLASTEIKAYHPFAHQLLGTLSAPKLDDYYAFYRNTIKTDDDKALAYGRTVTSDGRASFHELKSPYAIYNWEPGLHIPMLMIDRLIASRQYDLALQVAHYVLNPFAADTPDDPVWGFIPFQDLDATVDLHDLLLSLKPNEPNSEIENWRKNPFQPHVVARGRPTSYMKWVAMQYIRIWIEYGDYYFRQNTLETLPYAIQCYVTAAHVYGPPGELIPKRGNTRPQTYNSLLDKWDAFGNALVELELALPFSNQINSETGSSNGVVGQPNIFGFASTLYFCIPDNPELRALRSTIDDRLFNIRHCRDINGVFRKLPLFEPPIDPALLVEAAAQGLSLDAVLADLNSPMPNYRFPYLLQKALELCVELKSLGNAFLSANEKTDGEALAQLRAKHETSIQTLIMEVRKHQLEEANSALEGLQESRKGPVNRLQHQLRLIGEDLGRIPQTDIDFIEVPEQIEMPVEDSGLKLTMFEKEEFDKARAARDWQTGIGIVETLASVFHAIPIVAAHATPVGVGAAVGWGGSNLGSATQAVARGLQIYSNTLSYDSTNAGRKAAMQRQLQDRVQGANSAGYEIKNIDRQALTQRIRIKLAEQEINNQQRQIDHATEIEEFYRNKYTNAELYTWMDTQARTLYYQAYTFAYDLAKKAEKVFRFERGTADDPLVKIGYWDTTHDGLFAGERLYAALKQLEAAYLERRGHEFEIVKSLSLRQLDPLALMDLRETGSCEFEIPEVLFDMDYPGHYARRIKSVSLQVPTVLGPHTSLNCTLRLLAHRYRQNNVAKDAGDYPETTDEADDRFTTTNVPITAVAVSSLDTDTGLFEVNFQAERYLPFEGAGTTSRWRLELPPDFRQFDYDTISDIVLRLRYTAIDGGQKLRQAAAGAVTGYVKSVEDLSQHEGLFATFDLTSDFSNEWYSAMHPATNATARVIRLENLNERLPFFTKNRKASELVATDIYVYVRGPINASDITATQGGNDIAFTEGPSIGTTKTFNARDVNCSMDHLELTISDMTTGLDKMWIVERYTLK